MFIQTETMSDPASMRFLPGQRVLTAGTEGFPDAASAGRSPLAQSLFEIEGVAGVFLEPESIIVEKGGEKDWQILKPAVLGAIMEHFTAGRPVIVDEEADADSASEDDEVTAKIKELIDTRIRPAAAQDGGDVIFRGFKDGVVLLEMVGSGYGLKDGVENMLRHYVPEVTGVSDFRDAEAKPGLDTPAGKAIQTLLDDMVNPSVAAHGGHISLVDVREDTAYIRLEGGCQGCGMADVTLKQGVATEIQRVAPDIVTVLDVTDHAGGDNPYYQPGKGGMSPM